MTVVVGCWVPNGDALHELHGKPVLRHTLRRCAVSSYFQAVLLPWSPDLDWIEAEVKSWKAGYTVYRTHTDKRIAMRDLVAEKAADIGLLVDGTCAVIDAAEIHLAVARLTHEITTGGGGFGPMAGQYLTSRLWGCRASEWLRTSDDEEWKEIVPVKELARFYETPHDVETAARRLKARRET